MPFVVGERVRARNNPALIGEVVAMLADGEGGRSYRVRFPNGTRLVVESSLEADVPMQDPRTQLIDGAWAAVPDLRLLLTGIRLRQFNLTDQIRSLRAARLEHLPFQYKPLLKFLESEHQRVLIADEVGLGKTIEAAFILSELTARTDVRRVLIVVPSNLRSKWQRELYERFDEQFEIRDSQWVQSVLLSPSVGEELPRFRAIVSIEGIRRLAPIFEERHPPLDLVIVDEAHRLRNEGTLSYRLARALSDAADGMLLCSATPLQTRTKDLYNLLRVMLGDEAGTFVDFSRDLETNRPLVRCSALISSGELPKAIANALDEAAASTPKERLHDRKILKTEASMLRSAGSTISPARRAELLATINKLNLLGGLLTRTRKRDVMKHRPERVAKILNVEFTPQERFVYDSIIEAAGQTLREYGEWSAAALVMISRARQAASCLAVFLERLQSAALDDEGESSIGAEMALSDNTDPTAEPVVTGEDAVHLLEPIRRKIGGIKLPTDSKLTEFLGFLEDLRRVDPNYKVVVFSTFRDTVHYLSKKLNEHKIDHRVMTGMVATGGERDVIIKTFRDDFTCHALLTTEVGGEGIDLQFCSVVINYDLPWNPMVVEQRIGRLDRIGQRAREIRIVAFNVKDTVESRILDRLYRRIELFKDSVGPLEVILGEQTQRLSLELLALTPEEQNRKLQEAEIAIETARMQADQLDREAITLLGDDAYYEQRLVEVERAQGDIARDLEIFVRVALSTKWPRATLVAGRMKGVLKLTRDSELVRWLQEQGQVRRGLALFARRYAGAGDNGIEVTFNQEVAESLREIEFLTSRHPFVGALAAEIDPGVKVAAFAARLQGVDVPPGMYLLGIGLQQISGLRPRRELVAAATPLESGTALSDDTADQLMFSLAETGMPFDGTEVNRHVLATAADRCEFALLDRAKTRAEVLREENSVFVERRISSLERWFGRRIEHADRLASTHLDERVRKMNVGQRELLRARLEGELASARDKVAVTCDVEPKAYVVLKIIEGAP